MRFELPLFISFSPYSPFLDFVYYSSHTLWHVLCYFNWMGQSSGTISEAEFPCELQIGITKRVLKKSLNTVYLVCVLTVWQCKYINHRIILLLCILQLNDISFDIILINIKPITHPRAGVCFICITIVIQCFLLIYWINLQYKTICYFAVITGN